jgi:hypothetical protein
MLHNMNKCLIILILLFQCNQAYSDSKASLKIAGDTLANYQACETLSTQFNDPVLAYYYHDMKEMSRLDNKMVFSLNEHVQIEDEYTNALSTLNKLNQSSLFHLCLSRFDAVSRQHYKKKLEGQ